MRDMLLILFGVALAIFIELFASGLLSWLLRPKGIRRVILMPLFGGNDDLESRLRWEFFCLDEAANHGEKLLAAVDMGLLESERVIAEKLLADRVDAVLCNRENLSNILGDKVYKELEFVLYYD